MSPLVSILTLVTLVALGSRIISSLDAKVLAVMRPVLSSLTQRVGRSEKCNDACD